MTAALACEARGYARTCVGAGMKASSSKGAATATLGRKAGDVDENMRE